MVFVFVYVNDKHRPKAGAYRQQIPIANRKFLRDSALFAICFVFYGPYGIQTAVTNRNILGCYL